MFLVCAGKNQSPEQQCLNNQLARKRKISGENLALTDILSGFGLGKYINYRITKSVVIKSINFFGTLKEFLYTMSNLGVFSYEIKEDMVIIRDKSERYMKFYHTISGMNNIQNFLTRLIALDKQCFYNIDKETGLISFFAPWDKHMIFSDFLQEHKNHQKYFSVEILCVTFISSHTDIPIKLDNIAEKLNRMWHIDSAAQWGGTILGCISEMFDSNNKLQISLGGSQRIRVKNGQESVFSGQTGGNPHHDFKQIIGKLKNLKQLPNNFYNGKHDSVIKMESKVKILEEKTGDLLANLNILVHTDKVIENVQTEISTKLGKTELVSLRQDNIEKESSYFGFLSNILGQSGISNRYSHTMIFMRIIENNNQDGNNVS
jgi:hypothetical protein